MHASAAFFAEVHALDELQLLYSNEKYRELPKWILGGGSNLLLTKDLDCLVVHIANKGIEVLSETAQDVLVKVSAGEVWHHWVMYAVEHKWFGVENMALIPGSVGAAPVQNIGAYGCELKDVLYSLEAWNTETRSLEIFTNDQCKFGYRQSIFKSVAKGKYIIWAVTFLLNKNGKLNTTYGAIRDVLSAQEIVEPEITDVCNAVISIRKNKLPDPAQIGNSGSFFKNPEVELDHFEKIKSAYPLLPSYPSALNGKVKMSAAWLIEQCGWKGYRRGDAGCHALQALVLVNYGNASGAEIWQLAQDIIKSVHDKFDIQLEPEVNIY